MGMGVVTSMGMGVVTSISRLCLGRMLIITQVWSTGSGIGVVYLQGYGCGLSAGIWVWSFSRCMGVVCSQ